MQEGILGMYMYVFFFTTIPVINFKKIEIELLTNKIETEFHKVNININDCVKHIKDKI